VTAVPFNMYVSTGCAAYIQYQIGQIELQAECVAINVPLEAVCVFGNLIAAAKESDG
jgi:hypothetical protein